MREDFYGMDPVLVALYQAAHQYRDPVTKRRGVMALAERMNTHAGTLQNKYNVANRTHEPSLQDFRQTILHTNDLAPLDELCASFNQIMVSADDGEVEDVPSLFDALATVASEHGDVARELQAGFADGEFSSDESRRLSQEIREAVRALMLLDKLQKSLVREG